jgi:4-amino-4-deoxy-L-arabinose transferase-like glycosyltransferase
MNLHVPLPLKNSSLSRQRVLLGLLLLAGFWLRINFLVAAIFHTDEYYSMLAAQMTAEGGLPILPSGLFYDHGLLLSFLAGLLVALLDFREEIVRWPVLLVGTITIAVYYTVARTMFASRTAGLIAAALAAVDTLSIHWDGRARMYALAHLGVLLSLAWLLKGTFQAPSERNRYLFLLFLAATLLSHTITFLILPLLAILTAAFTLIYNQRWLHQRRLWLQAGAGLLLLSGILIIVRLGQTSSTISFQSYQPAPSASPVLGFLNYFVRPGLTQSRFDDLTAFFFSPPYSWLLLAISLGGLITVVRFYQGQATFADWSFCFLALYAILIIVEMGSLLNPSWQSPRYLFMLNLPAFLLLAAESLSRLLHLGERGWLKIAAHFGRSGGIRAALPWAGVLVVVVLTGLPDWEDAYVPSLRSSGGYNTAFEFVGQQWQAGDKVMSVHSAAAYLYLRRCDYYANQVTAKVIASREDPTRLVSRYAGCPLIDSVEELNAALAREKRLWFVVDLARLYSRYDYFFTQQIFAQMNYVQHFGPVYVFVSEPFPRPLPASPAVSLEAQFGQIVRLEGYSLDINTLAPDDSLPLHLYWRPLTADPGPVKVFVQLRNQAGQNIAQADHFFFETLLTTKETKREWQDLQEQGEWFRETAMLYLPLPLPAEQGPYQIYLGLYHPDTFERLPLFNDASGENAVVLPFPELP